MSCPMKKLMEEDPVEAAATAMASMGALPREQRHLLMRIARKKWISEADAAAITDDALSLLIDLTDTPDA